MAGIVVCLSALLFLVKAGTVPIKTIYEDALYDARSKAYYSVHNEPATWFTAYTTCVEEGGQLAVVNDKNKKSLLSLYPEFAKRVFLGFNQWETGLWRTIHGQSLKVEGNNDWNYGEPDNLGGNQRCGIIYKSGPFGDYGCLEKNPFICQINAFPQAYTYYEGTKTYYKFHVKPKTWLAAVHTCVEEGGHLAVINSQEEANYFVWNFPSNSENVFLGFSNWENGTWMTIHGKLLSDVGYAKWAIGEPKTAETQRCGAMYKNGEFIVNHCDAMLPFICEKIESPTESNCNEENDTTTTKWTETTTTGSTLGDWITTVADTETTPTDSTLDDWITTVADTETTTTYSTLDDWTTTPADTDNTDTKTDWSETTTTVSTLDDGTTTSSDVNGPSGCEDSPHYANICKRASHSLCRGSYSKMCCKSCSKFQGI